MTNYQEAKVKLTNTQLNKLKSGAKNKAGTILRLNKKNFEDEELSHELFLTTRQTTKIRNVFANNLSTDIKLSKAQISKVIQSGGSFFRKESTCKHCYFFSKRQFTWISKQFKFKCNK